MGGFFEELKRGYKGDDSQHYRVAGIQVTCSHCGGQEFDTGSALLNTTGMTLLGLDWANRDASLLICAKCGHVEWFLAEPERI
ncbi:MAG: DNA-binding protein [Coriobacteriia bacterium]|nr:DNA-binding protein [Coriobacteriia bacterium]MBN2822302.1 DNA-binding protein [Coriobacteriia bacterium]